MKKRNLFPPLILILSTLAMIGCERKVQVEELDLLIKGGRIVDGTGNPWYYGDLGIKGEKILVMGHLDELSSKKVIDASGLVVAPGFIDMLGQSELALLVDKRAMSKITQGITTEVTGEGESIAPVNDLILKDWQPTLQKYNLTVDWKTLGEYFQRLERDGTSINLATFIGATQVRVFVLGHDDRPPTEEELQKMKALVAEGMKDGALGVSSSLVYAPASYAKTDELIELCKVASQFGGVYATHIRNEGSGIFPALEEAIRISEEAKIPVEVWHLKVAGKPQWGRMPEVVHFIERARTRGVDITADQYPYTAGATGLSASLPHWAHEGGVEKLLERLRDPATRRKIREDVVTLSEAQENFYRGAGGAEGILITSVNNEALKIYEGKRLHEIARLRGEDPVETLFNLLIEDKGQVGAIYFSQNEEDMKVAMRQPWVSVNTDFNAAATDGPLSRSKVHPRSYGSFPRILGRYVREQRVLSLEEAIRKMTSLPAQRVGLKERGLLRPGMYGDVVVFDAERVIDIATYENPHQYSEGIHYVVVNGQIVLEKGKHTGRYPGKGLRGPGFSR